MSRANISEAARTKPCRQCGLVDRYPVTNQCKPCTLRKSQARRQANLEETRAKEREYWAVPENRAKKAAYRAANRDAIKAYAAKYDQANWRRRKDLRLQRDFGISLEDYERMLVQQGGKCAICESCKPGGVGGFHTDHCHSTGIVRGLLCKNCNTALGLFQDSPDTMCRAAAYVERFRKRVAA